MVCSEIHNIEFQSSACIFHCFSVKNVSLRKESDKRKNYSIISLCFSKKIHSLANFSMHFTTAM